MASVVANSTLIARDRASALQAPFGQPILLASAGFIRSPKKKFSVLVELLEFPMALLILISSRDSSSLDSLQLHSPDRELELSIIRAPTASLSFIVLELAVVSLVKLLTQVCCPILTVDFLIMSVGHVQYGIEKLRASSTI